MLANPIKTKTLAVTRLREHTPNCLFYSTVVEVSQMKVLGVILDPKLKFEFSLKFTAASASIKLGILRKAALYTCFMTLHL